METIKIVNWSRHQHFKDRRPLWIKLYRDILDDFTFQTMPVESRALLPMLWLMATEGKNKGEIEGGIKAIMFRLRMTQDEVLYSIKPLLDNNFLTSDIKLISNVYQNDSLETEKRQRREETEKKEYAPSKIEVALNTNQPEMKVTQNEKAKRNTTSPFPHGEQCPDEWANWASRNTSLTQSDIDRQYATARDWALGKGERKADWLAFWRNWCRRNDGAASQQRDSFTGSQKKSPLAAAYAAVVASREGSE